MLSVRKERPLVYFRGTFRVARGNAACPAYLQAMDAAGGSTLNENNNTATAAQYSNVCFRGIEKFRDPMAKMKTQRLVKHYILRQQQQTSKASCCPELLATLSRYLSQPSHEMAHRSAYRLALLSAQEMMEMMEDTGMVSDNEDRITRTRHARSRPLLGLCLRRLLAKDGLRITLEYSSKLMILQNNRRSKYS